MEVLDTKRGYFQKNGTIKVGVLLMQVILTSGNDINARNTTTASERETITAKAGNGVIIEKWLQRSRG